MVLDNGYEYETIMQDIMNSFYYGTKFQWSSYMNRNQEPDRQNLLKAGTRYYHKNLLVMNSPVTVTHDIDSGTMVSQEKQFFVEPRASYTMYELVSYFYERTGVDNREAEGNQFSRKRVSSYLQAMLRNIDIDTALFLIEAAGRNHDTHERIFSTFTLKTFADFMPEAEEYIRNIKESADSTIGGSDYVIKRRMLPH